MAEYSGFFDAHSSVDENGKVVHDRVYLAEHFAKYFASFIGNGIFAGKSNELMVKQQDTPNMSVKVLSGKGWIDGYFYDNDSELTLSFDVADGVLNRIDIIVLRWSNSERVIRLNVKKGVSATKPTVPSLQRDDDIYELKLAEVFIKAGSTNITQANITDTRLDYSVCGFVHAIIEQLDAAEFGSQLNDYIENFMVTNDAWFAGFQSDSDEAVDDLIAANQDRINVLVGELESVVNGNAVALLQDSVEDILTQITAINIDISKLKTDVSSNSSSIASIINDTNIIKSNITGMKTDITGLQNNLTNVNKLFVESTQYSGCFYRMTTSNETEWVNPPDEVGVEYRTTERWFGNPVYKKSFYVGALPNKSMMTIAANAAFNNITSITGFAIDTDNNMFHPFPVIINGLTPIAVIQSAEGDGGDGCNIIIQTNDDISHMYGCITIKYTKQ